MEKVTSVIEKKIIDGILWIAENPKKSFNTVALTAWTILSYRRGFQSGRAVGFADAISALSGQKTRFSIPAITKVSVGKK